MHKGAEPLGISIVSGENGGIFVSKVTGGSIAHQAGLEYGDQLLEVGTTTPPSPLLPLPVSRKVSAPTGTNGAGWRASFREEKKKPAIRSRLMSKAADLMHGFFKGPVVPAASSFHLFRPDERIHYRCHGSRRSSAGRNAAAPKSTSHRR